MKKPWLRSATCFLILGSAFASANADPPALGRMIDAGGYRVHLYCTGAGSPLVIVTGAGFSFDWGLIQPEVAKFTRICTYDPSGTAWSDPPPKQVDHGAPTCSDRVTELHSVLQTAHETGPYVLVGFSIGGLVSRLYAQEYPTETSAVVLVDHAFIDVDFDAATPLPVPSSPAKDSPPVLVFAPPITLSLADDRNFVKLSKLDQDLHAWAISRDPVRPTPETAAECSAKLERGTGAYPLGNKPLIVVRTENRSAAYDSLQAKLLKLSRTSRQVIAGNSSHMVILDEPELVVKAIREAVESVQANR